MRDLSFTQLYLEEVVVVVRPGHPILDDPDLRPLAETLRLDFPVFEGGGTHVNVSGVAMTKAAPNRDNAVKLMEFLASHTGQELYAEINDEYPVDPSVPASALVTSWGSFTPDALNLMDIAHMRPAALRLTETVDFDG